MRPFDFTPRDRYQASGGFWLLVPWLSVFVLLGGAFVLSGTVSVIPGSVVVPEAGGELREGMLRGLMMVAVPVERAEGDTAMAVFFDDARYMADAGGGWSELARKVGVLAEGRKELNLLVDRRLAHGLVVKLVDALRRAGVARINLVQKPQ